MPKRAASRKLTVYALLILAVVFFHISGWLNPVYDPLTGMLLRLAAPFHAAGDGLRRTLGTDEAGMAEDNEELVRTVEGLRIENAKLLMLASENEALKAALSFRELGEDRTVAAKIVYETSEDESRLLVIDKGSVDGLRVGQPVVTGNGVLTGKLFAVRERTAIVLPLTDSRSRLAVAVQNSPETLGVLEGDRGLSMSIALIPQTDLLSPGDAVITSGLEPGIRRGLLVGTVEKVNRSTQDPFQSANVAAFSEALHPLLVQVIISEALD